LYVMSWSGVSMHTQCI